MGDHASVLRLAAILSVIAFGAGGCALFGGREDPLRWKDPTVSLAPSDAPGVSCPPGAIFLNIRRDGSVRFGGLMMREETLARFLRRAADLMREEKEPAERSDVPPEDEEDLWQRGFFGEIPPGKVLGLREEGLSDRPVVLRVDREAAWESVQRVMWHARDAGLYRYFFAARRSDSGVETLLSAEDYETVSAVEGWHSLEHVRIKIFERSDGRGVECRVNQAPVPIDPARDPSARNLGDHLRDLMRIGGNVPVIIDLGSQAPAGCAISALNRANIAGFEEVRFTLPDFIRRAPLPHSRKSASRP